MSALGFTVAERVLYVPSVGYCLLVIALLSHLIPNDVFEDAHAQAVDDTQPAAKSTSAQAKPGKVLSKKTILVLVVVLLVIGAYSVR